MGLNTYAAVDILNVHDYEQRAIVKDDKTGTTLNTWLYSAYYEYYVTAEPLRESKDIPEEAWGKFAWWCRIYNRGDGNLLQRVDGLAKTYSGGRGAAQKAIKKAMETYRRTQS